MDESVFRYVWRHTRPQQIWLFVVLLVSLPFYYLTLDLPKSIVNGPIQGAWTPGETRTLFAFRLHLPDFLGGGRLFAFEGIPFDRVGVLVSLSLTFLFFVVVNGLLKFYLSNYKGQLGERLLRRLRYDLVDRVLRFPTAHFKQIRGPEVASMIKDETEPVGGFGGSAFADPALLLSQALTALIFIVLQNRWLGAVAGAVVLFQLLLIPRMRRRLVVLATRRQLTARLLSGRIGEIVESIASIRTNDTSNWERAEIGDRLAKILTIRYAFYRWKFFVNFINNLISQATPFVFYLAGGYLTITGRLDIGQLVAVIAAYKDLPAPLKDLITWDQLRVDVQSKYDQIREQFTMSDLIEPEVQAVSVEAPPHIVRDVAVLGLRIGDESGGELLHATSLRLSPGETVAAIGPIGAGGEYLAEALVRLTLPEGGRISVDGQLLDALPDAFTGRRIAYATAGLVLPRTTIRDALLYGLRHAPLVKKERPAGEEGVRLMEARESGNIDLDIRDDWVDYAAAGIAGPADVPARLAAVLEIAGLKGDVWRLGLRNRLPATLPAAVPPRILEARARFQARLAETGSQVYFERFDLQSYSNYASVLENLVFGIAARDGIESDLAVVRVLHETGLGRTLGAMGRGIAAQLLEIFGDLDPDNPLMNDIDLIAPDEIEFFRAALRRQSGKADPLPEDVRAFQRLAFGYVEPRHRLGLLTEDTKRAVLVGRAAFRKRLDAGESAGAVVPLKADTINPAASLQDNVMFGRIVDRYADASTHIDAVLVETLKTVGLAEIGFEFGLDFDVGSGGKRLSAVQQQRLVLARALLKRADLFVLNRPLPSLDADSQRATIERVLASRHALGAESQTILWVLSDATHAPLFDRVLEFRDGRLVEVPAAQVEQRVAEHA